MKKFCALLFLCLFACFGFVSAPEEISFQKNAFRIVRQSNDAGKIGLSYIFPLNSQLMIESGISEKDLAVYKFYLVSYINVMAKNSKENAVDGVAVSDCTYYQDVDGVGYTLIFDDIKAQQKYFNSETNDTNNFKPQTSGFFVKTIKLKTIFPVSSQKIARDLRLICLLAVNAWADSCEISAEQKSKVEAIINDSVFIYDNATQIKSGTIDGNLIRGGTIMAGALDEVLNNKIDKNIQSVKVQYAMNQSQTEAPATGWQDDAPEWQEGHYIWQRTETTLADGTTTYSDALCITGVKGSDGKDGADGKDAVVLIIDSSNGVMFKNSSIATTLTVTIVVGETMIW